MTVPHRDWLERVERSTPTVAGNRWAVRAVRRIDAHGVEHGDTYHDRSLRDLVRELDEEALDLGGWAALLAERLEAAPLCVHRRAQAARALKAIARLGAEADALCVLLDLELDDPDEPVRLPLTFVPDEAP